MAGGSARTLGLIASAAVVVGALGPWQTTFLVDFAGTDGDGLITLCLGLIAGLLVATKPPGSGWLALAGLLAGIAAVVAAFDLVQILTDEQEILGRRVDLVQPGWGIWLSVGAALALAACAAKLWIGEEDAVES